ncbi:MAG: hypothetical protein J6T85_01380 [Paludibacteraceae bacterium]|nr:hypothetical protein [Paludibacteraceae bacterium]
MKHHLGAIILMIVCSLTAAAQDRGENISPRHFGPNAFPVPAMLDGRVSETLKVELAGDWYHGYAGDETADVFARIYIPLFTKRVNLVVWMPICEWYRMTEERQRECLIQDTARISGHGFGDVYISTDIQVLRARRWWPDITIRAAMKTASGEQYELARHYDDPAYFFDASVGKSMFIGGGMVTATRQSASDWELRLAGSMGFLCWQTTTAHQNDAYQYGLQLLVRQQYVSARVTWSGYSGWQKNGDKPMVINTQLRGHAPYGLEPFIDYQYGIRDYPFHQLRVGLAYNLDIIGLAKGNK